MNLEKISINLEPEIDRDSVNRLQEAMSELDPGGEIRITLENADAHQADSILGLLDENGFDYQSKGSHDGKTYYINAKRKLN